MSSLFESLRLRELTVPNRIFLAPMCQYQCENQDGVPGDWHLMHYGARAAGGFGLIIAEATGVVPDGRITPQCCGLWNDDQTAAWARIVNFCHTQGAKMAIQLQHAGRKASVYRDFDPSKFGSVPLSDGGWPTVAPSAIPYPGLATPSEATEADLADVVDAFTAAARRADAAGFDAVEIHAAHGYLLFQFLSPLSNKRTDGYGGDLDGRARLLLEVTDAVRAAWPAHKPVLVRISATEWTEGGFTVDDATEVARKLAQHGVDMIDVSSGGNLPAKIPAGPGYQVPLAAAVRSAGLPVIAAGLITDPGQAQSILDAGNADAIGLARVALREPAWPQRAAAELDADAQARYPASYRRGRWPTGEPAR